MFLSTYAKICMHYIDLIWNVLFRRIHWSKLSSPLSIGKHWPATKWTAIAACIGRQSTNTGNTAKPHSNGDWIEICIRLIMPPTPNSQQRMPAPVSGHTMVENDHCILTLWLEIHERNEWEADVLDIEKAYFREVLLDELLAPYTRMHYVRLCFM